MRFGCNAHTKPRELARKNAFDTICVQEAMRWMSCQKGVAQEGSASSGLEAFEPQGSTSCDPLRQLPSNTKPEEMARKTIDSCSGVPQCLCHTVLRSTSSPIRSGAIAPQDDTDRVTWQNDAGDDDGSTAH
uniref:Uncharacterized protein n=1 Tax=Noctiluca scintillans TaxID=2966 RepID=A0A7S1AN97_NOCSC|mmetsp:Transcript_53288/g.142605  ORF Transcript_53288/g.142605 Transcript_53288/m.142605 type:complete len:131 (+) Transcript_53288:102-494(+)